MKHRFRFSDRQQSNKIREAQVLHAPFQRIHSMKFFQMVEGYESAVRVGQDLADTFVGIKDFEGAEEFMEQHVLPVVVQVGLIGRMVQVRSQYAVILAWCGDHHGAVTEIKRIDPYVEGLDEDQRREIDGLTALIASSSAKPGVWRRRKRWWGWHGMSGARVVRG